MTTVQLEDGAIEAVVRARRRDLLVADDPLRSRRIYIPLHQVKGFKGSFAAEPDGAHERDGESAERTIGSEPRDEAGIGATVLPTGYRAMLLEAKGTFAELRLSARHVLHGYLAGVMNDFALFCTPLHGAVLLPLEHVQALSPYPAGLSPYRLKPEQFPIRPLSLGLSRHFEQQLERLEGEMTVLCRGGYPDVAGVLGPVKDGFVPITEADGGKLLLPVRALKAVFL
ncbi:hypothetical protein HGI30_07235 [Paenibacillus albicereus]|uniref:DUF2642 domain-containing protein n=1 Tax=Paenibacillus albicereus TaxID=2726185 RepID=A0A6H2GVB9_9BACL|nr:hypothetical protein [Paenibacillus albicereus]QJC51360.1 hypothetical protein HGI30_07235 [Paenibacillus albicereus]